MDAVTLPIPLTADQRSEIQHRLNNGLQVILSAAQLELTHSEDAETRVRAKAIVTAVSRMSADVKELFG